MATPTKRQGTKRTIVSTPRSAKARLCKTPERLRFLSTDSPVRHTSLAKKQLTNYFESNNADLGVNVIPDENIATPIILRYGEHAVKFRTKTLAKEMLPVCRALANGSVRKCLKMLSSSKQPSTRKSFQKGLSDIIHSECSTLVKKTNSEHLRSKSVNEFNKVNLFNLQADIETSAPSLWTTLSTAAQNRKKQKKCSSIPAILLSACSVLKERNIKLNYLQKIIGLAMHQNRLQKEGYGVLTRFGVTASYDTVNRLLQKAAMVTENIISMWKSNLEANHQVERYEHSSISLDHSYTACVEKDLSAASDGDHTYSHMPEIQMQSSLATGYRLNIDNLDCEIKARSMTQTHKNVSKHYVQAMAVEDRVNCESLPIEGPQQDLISIPNEEFLPTRDDSYALRNDLIHVMGIIIVSNIPSFKCFTNVFEDHFSHIYSKEMKKKSRVIPLGIFDKNENKANEIIDLMKSLQDYVPGATPLKKISTSDISFPDKTAGMMRPIPIGGDQLTCERIRGAHMARLDGETPEERLEGLFTMIEDFHEKINFLQAYMDKLYTVQSARDGGTLGQLRNLINRRNVVTTVSKDYHAVSEFVDLTTDSHVIAATMQYLQMKDINSKPSNFPVGIQAWNESQKRNFFMQMVSEIVDHFIFNKISESLENIEESAAGRGQESTNKDQDNVFNYAVTAMTLGLLRRISVMTTAAGDGQRCIRNWKFSLLLYHDTKKTKYRLEAFLLQASIKSLLPKRLAHQVMWNRFVNLSGGEGSNLDGDYVMEYLNRLAKDRIKMLGPNHQSSVVDRIGKTVLFCSDIVMNLQKELDRSRPSSRHTYASTKEDQKTIIEELHVRAKVFCFTPGRSHGLFPHIPRDIFAGLKVVDLHRWLNEKKIDYCGKKWAF